MKAANHEPKLLTLVGPEWRIDPDGSIWRVAVKLSGTAPLRTIEPRRTEVPAPDGYLRVQGRVAGASYRVLAHRMVWTALRGPIPDGMQINHINGVKTDNRPENLEVVTPRQNVVHRQAVLGHKPPGGYRVGSVKLTETDVLEIRRLVATGTSETELASRFGVTRQTIHYAAIGKTWRHLEQAAPTHGGAA